MNICRQTENKYGPVRIIISILLVVALVVPLGGMLGVGNLNLVTRPDALRVITEQSLTAAPLPGASAGNPRETDSNSTESDIQNLEEMGADAEIAPVSWDFSLEGLQEGLEKLVFDLILKVIQEHIDSGMAMDPQQLWAFYDRSPSKEFLTEKMVGFVRDMIYGTRDTTLTLEEVEQLIDENQALLEESFGFRFTELHRYICLKLVEHSGALEILEQEGMPGLLRWTAQADKVNGAARLQQLEETEKQLVQLRRARELTSLLLPGAAAMVVLLLLCLVHYHRPWAVLICLGTALTVCGLAFAGPMLAGLLKPELLTAFSQAWMNSSVNGPGMAAGVKLLLPLNLTVLAVGAVLLPVGVLLDRKTAR